MCGIAGYVGDRESADVLVDALSKLEYRGYDSAGIAVFDHGNIKVKKCKGRLANLVEKMDEEGNEFVSNVSHELKTPLTSMKVLADSLLLQEDAPVELYKEFMGDMSEEIERENKIINDLLSLVKMDKTANTMNIKSENMNELRIQ